MSGTSEAKGPAGLTAREQQVLFLICDGCSTKVIAERLGITIHTVISHREHIKRKLGIRHTAGLVRYAIRNGLIAP